MWTTKGAKTKKIHSQGILKEMIKLFQESQISLIDLQEDYKPSSQG